MVRNMSKKIGHLKPQTKTFNRTLLIESSSCAFDKDKVVEYFVKKYTEFELINVDWSPWTHNLQELYADLKLTEDILEFCGEEEYKRICCNNSKDAQHYKQLRRDLSLKIVGGKRKCCLLFMQYK